METYAVFGAGLIIGIMIALFLASIFLSALDRRQPDPPLVPIEPELTAKIKYWPGMKPVFQAHYGEWYDLRARDTITYKAGDIVSIPLGIAMELPRGYEAKVETRSSTSRKYGLVYCDSGVIDNEWREEWGSTWYAARSGMIRKNTRICQFRFQHTQPPARFNVVDHVESSDRGGYGSTGEM